MYLYKILSKSGKACNGGKYQYDLPKNGKPGAWTTRIEQVVRCRFGYHVTSAVYVDAWRGLQANKRLFVVQVRGTKGSLLLDDKLVCKQIRLLREIHLNGLDRRLLRWKYDVAMIGADRRYDLYGRYGYIFRITRARMTRVCAYIERKMGWTKPRKR